MLPTSSPPLPLRSQSQAPLRVLGVDPGTRLMGWAVIEGAAGRFRALGHGVLRAPADSDIASRLATLARGLRQVVEAHRPSEAAIEEVFYGKDVRAAVRIGEGRGAAMLVLAEAAIAVHGYANNVVKKAVAGGGRADKRRVQAMVLRILALTEQPETLDASDALALALCHHQRRGLTTGGGLPSSARGVPPRLAEAIFRARRGAKR